MTNPQRHRKISTFGSQVTSVISVTLVLLILGIIMLGGIAARGVSHAIRESIGIVAEIRQDVAASDIAALTDYIKSKPYTASAVYITPDEILAQESKQFGEDMMALLDGTNPYNGEIEVKVTEDYANSDSLNVIASVLEGREEVEKVTMHTGIVDTINHALRNATLTLSAIGVVLLIISFALINNTVSLSIYSRRFLIHTMRLVGAKASFIRRPFVIAGILNGLVAGLIAAAALGAMWFYLVETYPGVDVLIDATSVGITALALVIVGMGLCALASAIAANRYLRSGYDKLFK